MKIIAIMGSPHKGNTLELTQRVEERLKTLGDMDFEYLHLKDADLKPSLYAIAQDLKCLFTSILARITFS